MVRFLAALAPLLFHLAACGGEAPAAPTPDSPTPRATATSLPFAPTSTPTPAPQPTATPTAIPPIHTPTHTPTPEPSPAFDPGPVILPTVAIPTATPTAVPEDPLAKTLDAIGLRVNVLRELSLEQPVDRQFITYEELETFFRQELDDSRDELD